MTTAFDLPACAWVNASAFGTQTNDGIWTTIYPAWDTAAGEKAHIARLTRLDVDMGGLNVAWQKSFHKDDIVDPIKRSNVVALSAFLLSSLPTSVDKKILVKEMWESGAEVIVRTGTPTV